MNQSEAFRRESGFTLVEVLVAFSVLLIGMTGIISMFGTGLRLEQKGRIAYDSAVLLDELRPIVEKEILERSKADPTAEVRIPATDVPNRPGLAYGVRAVPLSSDAGSATWLTEIRVSPRGAPEDEAFSFGWLPIRLAPRQDELARRLMEGTR